ncbi:MULTISPECIES: hypothetical protein [Streptomyces]|uniref:Uncharacterized protein n=1 Tax=Streptomyces niveiscabiei TaxID=164115 RepID=A0ABW9I1F3_9ACTN|nr:MULTISPECIES: hypothetical protein [Streptomyces]MCQ9179087.1 hypothetical protein [Streptomyces hayashii]MBK3640136.1 hypothetical protein [Streptomyces sp. MBT33]MCX4573250.1 hypothetical protein [Streptomyces sp. NBC_01571]MDX3274727.1 hypothetical protein [Streptomyces scabiei]MDX3499293.1 hypothetical protein [Streptomyces turgidiscabies]
MSTMLPKPLLQEHRKRAMELSAAARTNLTAHVRSTDELRELGLMLGLIEVDPAGSLVTACPWDLDADDAAVDGTDRRRSESTST